jgi:hypothetical protein
MESSVSLATQEVSMKEWQLARMKTVHGTLDVHKGCSCCIIPDHFTMNG